MSAKGSRAVQKPPVTLDAFWHDFLLVEKRTKALSRRFGTIQLYAIQRTRIFYAIAEQLGLFENPHPHFTKPAVDVSVPAIENLDGLSPSASVFVPFRRRVGGREPYSEAVLARLSDAQKPARVIDFHPRLNSLGDYAPVSPDELDLERLKAFFAESTKERVARIMRFTSRRPQVEAWQRLIAEFEKAFDIKLEKFQKYPQWLVRRTLAEQIGFADLFRKLQATDLYIVNAYSEPSIVLGAHRAKMRVHEIQHGFISAYHPAYSFGLASDAGRGRIKRGPKLDSAPDTILTWGAYWGRGLRLANKTAVEVSGPSQPFCEYRNLVLSERRIVAGQILFTSQGAIARELFAAALATARAMPDHRVIYRLHPNEALADFDALIEEHRSTASAGPGGDEQSAVPANFSLSHRDPIFLDLVSQSEYLIGAFSTTLFEGLALGCKVLVLPLSGYENVLPAINAGDITLISNLEDLPNALASARLAENPFEYYAKEDHA